MDESLETSVVFQTYAVALNLMNKSLLMLAEKGADQKTLSFMVQTINSLIENINAFAGDLAMEKEWNHDLDQICERYKISRAAPPEKQGGE